MTKPKKFDARTWNTSERTAFVLEETKPGDSAIHAWIARDGDGPSTPLTAQEAREVSAELAHRADLLDPPKRPPLAEVPATPTAIIADYLRVAKTHMDKVFDVNVDTKTSYHRTMMIVDSFAVVALMAELEHIAPEHAARVAERLADAWEDGGSVHEFLWEWNEKHQQGKPVGFNPPATLDLDLNRD